MKKRSVYLMIPVLLLAGTLVMKAQPRGEMGPKIVKELGLSDEQAAKIKDLRSEHMKAMADVQADVKKAQIDLKDLMTAENPDKGAIKSKMKEVADLRLKTENARVDHMFAVRSILTPEQQKKWKETFAPMMRERAGRGFDRPGRECQRCEMMPHGRGMRQHERMRR